MRMPRISIQNALYYLTCRGDNEENIFQDAADYNAYLELLKKCKEQYGFKLFSYCFLPNHLHLLIELKENTSISQIMHNLNSNYTKYFNRKHNRQGHLLQERYKLILMEKTPYLVDTTAYIHLNPLAIMFDKDYENYSYSSYPLYIGKGNAILNINEEVSEVMSYLPGKNYAGFVRDFYQGKNKVFTEEIKRKSVLGSDEFIEKVKTEIESLKSEATDSGEDEERAKSAKRMQLVYGVSAVIVLAGLAYAVSVNTFGAKDRLQKELAKKESEISFKLSQENAQVVRNLDEKYRADMVSFEAMQRRLEMEKEKARGLEEKIAKGQVPEAVKKDGVR